MMEAVNLWNKSFEGYFLNMETTVNGFIARIANEGLHLENSLAVFKDSESIGLVLNGFRDIQGRKVAWNGGTGIAKEYRGQGIGKELMKRNLVLYAANGTDTATLEAITENEAAIHLYESVGYKTVDRLAVLTNSKPIDSLPIDSDYRYAVHRGRPAQIAALPFCFHEAAWQTQWPSLLREGEALWLSHNSKPVGYALYKRAFDEQGQITSISLYQCEAEPDSPDARTITHTLLKELFGPLDQPIRRTGVLLRESNKVLTETLTSLEFEETVKLVQMTYKFA
jgi:GNAT superfamily N-acetyltransferase